MKRYVLVLLVLLIFCTAAFSTGDGAIQYLVNGTPTGDPADLYWDAGAKRFGSGTTTPSQTFVVQRDFNSYNNLLVCNTSTGTSAGAGIFVGRDPAGSQQTYGGIWYFGSGYTPVGDMRVPDGTLIEGQGPGGVGLIATTGTIRFSTNGNFTSDYTMMGGRFGIGTTTPYLNSKLHIVDNRNGFAQFNVENPSTGNNARAGFLVGQNTATGIDYGLFSYTNSGWAAVGAIKPKQLVIQSLNEGGLNLLAEHPAATMTFVVGGYQDSQKRFELASTLGKFWVPVEASSFRVNGTQVVGTQCSAIPNIVDSVDAIAKLNQLLACLRSHGLIAE